MAHQNVLRTNITQAAKEIGVIEHLPQKPLTKKHILQRYNGFVGTTKSRVPVTEKENMPIHNTKLREKYIVKNICEEVMTLAEAILFADFKETVKQV